MQLSPRAHRILVQAHIETLLAAKGMQAFFVVNCVKFHLTPFIYIKENH